MKLNKGLNRDIDYPNQLSNTYRDGSNLVLSKDGDRLESELSSTSLDIIDTLYGDVIIGKIVASNEFILFVTQSTPVTLRIYRYKNDVATLILATTTFNVSIDAPIQGEYKYNYNQELVILFYSDVDIPRILNIDDLGFNVDSYREFINPLDEIYTRRFVSFNEPTFNLIEVNATGGNLLSGIYQLSIQYKLLDDSYSNHSLLSNPIYVYKFSPKDDIWNIYANESGIETSKSISVKISNIDTKFKQFRIGIVHKTETTTEAYVTSDYFTSYSNFVLSNKDSFISIDLSDVLVKNVNLHRIGASTIINKVLYPGNIKFEEDIKYQKYACNITSEFIFTDSIKLDEYKGSYKDEVILFSEKGFMPFEIYAFYIRFIRRSDGSVTNAFHIPGRELTPSEKAFSTDSEISNEYPNAREFHFKDYSGVNPINSPYTTKMGCWENELEYYTTDDNFNGSIDYDGNSISGGVTLNSGDTKVRHHRFPSLYSLQKSGQDIVEETTLLPDGYLIELSNPYVNSNPTSFAYQFSTNGIGVFNYNNAFTNNTGDILVGLCEVGVNISVTGSKTLLVELETIKADGTRKALLWSTTATGINPTINTVQTGVSATLFDDVTFPTESIRLLIRSFTSGTTTLSGNITYTGATYLKYNVTADVFIDEQLIGKKLGIKFSNIVIPQYIKDECSHFEILYAERTVSNITVLGYSYFREMYNTGIATTNFRTYPFDLLVNKPSLNIAAIRPELTFDTTFVTADNIDIDTPSLIDFDNAYIVNKAKYITNNVSYSSPSSNEYREEIVYMETAKEINLQGQPSMIISLLAYNTNLYTSFYNQTLVRTGRLISIPEVATVSSGDMYGGDSVHNMHGLLTYYNGGTIGSVVNFLFPIFSISNIGYRYTDDDPVNIFFPKYNMVDGVEGPSGAQSGVASVNGVWAKIQALYADVYTYIYELSEYYGYEKVLNSVNNLEPSIIYNEFNDFTTDFPYRVYRSSVQGSESLMDAWRTIRADQYYDSAYDKGYITQLDHADKDLLIEHESALFVIKSLDELEISNSIVASLGSSNIFASIPKEIIPTDEGYVGCQSKFASIRCPFGNIIVDRQQGKIFIYNNYQVDEITRYGLFKWFDDNLEYKLDGLLEDGIYLFDDGDDVDFDYGATRDEVIYATIEELEHKYWNIDNPYNDLGIFCSYDRDNERLIFTKNQDAVDSTESWTLSYYPRFKQWVSFHSYIPNITFNNRNGIYMGCTTNNQGVYQLVDGTTHGDYYDTSVYLPSFVDVCFATPYGIDKKYLSFSWNTTIKSLVDKLLHNVTFDKAIVYNYHRHSNEITLVNQTFGAGNVRETDDSWKLNDFRDLLSDKTLKMVDDLDIRELQYDTIPALSLYTNWYDKSLFIDTYCIIRLTFNNTGGDGIIINGVGSTNIQTGRI